VVEPTLGSQVHGHPPLVNSRNEIEQNPGAWFAQDYRSCRVIVSRKPKMPILGEKGCDLHSVDAPDAKAQSLATGCLGKAMTTFRQSA
jgi:hypothetical protein